MVRMDLTREKKKRMELLSSLALLLCRVQLTGDPTKVLTCWSRFKLGPIWVLDMKDLERTRFGSERT